MEAYITGVLQGEERLEAMRVEQRYHELIELRSKMDLQVVHEKYKRMCQQAEIKESLDLEKGTDTRDRDKLEK